MKAVGSNMKTNMEFNDMKSFFGYLTKGTNIDIDALNIDGTDYMPTNAYYWKLDERSLALTSNILQKHLDIEVKDYGYDFSDDELKGKTDGGNEEGKSEIEQEDPEPDQQPENQPENLEPEEPQEDNGQQQEQKNNLKKSKNSRNNKSNHKKNNHKRIINKDRKNNRKKIKSINDKKVLITSISTFFILFMIYESDGSISFKVKSAFVPSVSS